jgi:ketosteroid isomerase-like protein
MTPEEERNAELVRTFFATLSAGNLEQLRGMLHEQVTWTVMAKTIPGAGEKKGRTTVVDEFLAPVRSIFEDGDPKVTAESVIASGAMVAAEAKGLGRLKNGKYYDNRYAWFIEIRDGKIFALREYMDSHHVSTLM